MTKRKRAALQARTAVAYVRVSRDEDIQTLGIDAQRADIRAWAAREGVEIVGWREETVSGGADLKDRPELLQALADVAALHASHLVVQRLDRYSRDPVSAALAGAELAKAKATLATADGQGEGDDPTAKLVRGILLAVAEFERGMIGARIKAALAVKQERGELTGQPPYGMRAVDGPMRARRDGTSTPVRVLVEDAEEQETIARARVLGASLSVRAVSAALAAEGRFNRAGKPFTVRAMWEILSGKEDQ